MKLTSKDNKPIVHVSEVERKDADLLIRAKIAGLLPTVIYLTPEEMWSGMKLLNWPLIRYLPLFIVKGWCRQRKQAGHFPFSGVFTNWVRRVKNAFSSCFRRKKADG